MENIVKPDLLNWENTQIKGFLSKKLIEMRNGGFKLIKVEPGSSYPMHNHPEKAEFIYVLRGMPEIIIGDNCFSGKNREFFIIPASVKHRINNNGNTECILLVGAIKI